MRFGQLKVKPLDDYSANPHYWLDKVRGWLNSKSGRTTIPGGRAIWNRYVLFQTDLPLMLKEAGITRTELGQPEYYPDYVDFAVRWIREREAKAVRES